MYKVAQKTREILREDVMHSIHMLMENGVRFYCFLLLYVTVLRDEIRRLHLYLQFDTWGHGIHRLFPPILSSHFQVR